MHLYEDYTSVIVAIIKNPRLSLKPLASQACQEIAGLQVFMSNSIPLLKPWMLVSTPPWILLCGRWVLR